MNGPITTRRGTPWQGPSTSHATQAQISRTLELLRQMPTPDGLTERVEAQLATSRLRTKGLDGVPIGAWPFRAARFKAEGRPSPWWLHARVAACALAVAAASLGLVTDRATTVRTTTPMLTLPSHAQQSGLGTAAAVRIPTRTVEIGKASAARSDHPLGSGRSTVTRRRVLPLGVAVPRHPDAISSMPPAENDTAH